MLDFYSKNGHHICHDAQRIVHGWDRLVFGFPQVGIATEKVVNIERLSELAAAELFVASAPRKVRVTLSMSYLPFSVVAHAVLMHTYL